MTFLQTILVAVLGFFPILGFAQDFEKKLAEIRASVEKQKEHLGVKIETENEWLISQNLFDSDEKVRLEFVSGLGQFASITSPELAEHTISILRGVIRTDKSVKVRKAAIYSLIGINHNGRGNINTSNIVAAFHEALENDTNTEVRLLAIQALALMRTERATGILEEKRNIHDSTLRAEVVRQLGLLDRKEWISDFNFSTGEDPSVNTYSEAIMQMGGVSPDEHYTINSLAGTMLRDPEPVKRYDAILTIRHLIKDADFESVEHVFVEVFLKDNSVFVRRAAGETLLHYRANDKGVIKELAAVLSTTDDDRKNEVRKLLELLKAKKT